MNDRLLIKYIKRETTLTQTQQVKRWLKESQANREYFIQLQTLYAGIEMEKASPYSENEINQIFGVIRKKQIRKSLLLVTSVAATITLFIGLYGIYIPQESISYESLLTEINHQINNNITLTLDDQEVEMTDSSAVITYQPTGNIQINDTITYTAKETTLNKIVVPYGKRAHLKLADGSSVHLNSGSTFIFPASFTGKTREVFLDGEGFFDIEKDKNERKFIVKTSYKTIEVTGTLFNISVDRETETFETVLVSGAISVDAEEGPLAVQPGQYYGYSAQDRQEDIKKVDVIYYTSWIHGILHFRREPVRNILRKLEKNYHIKIDLPEKEYLDYSITGNLNLRDTPEETLDIVMSLMIPGYRKELQNPYTIQFFYQ